MKQLLLLLLAGCLLSACSKVPGCMDPDGANYDPLAEEDNGLCNYMGGAAFWHNEASAQSMIDDGITQIEFYVDGVFMDQVTPFTHWDTPPSCQSDIAFTIENYGLGSAKSKTFSYVVRDQDDNLIGSGNFTIYGNRCSTYEFVY